MTGFRRVVLALISTAALALAAGLLGALPATARPVADRAAAAPATPTPLPSLVLCFGIQPAPEYRRLGTYWDCYQCLRAGEAGVARGEWREFRCPGRPIGLDYEYDLYVR